MSTNIHGNKRVQIMGVGSVGRTPSAGMSQVLLCVEFNIHITEFI